MSDYSINQYLWLRWDMEFFSDFKSYRRINQLNPITYIRTDRKCKPCHNAITGFITYGNPVYDI